jgi:hypothetical protein
MRSTFARTDDGLFPSSFAGSPTRSLCHAMPEQHGQKEEM